MCSSDLEDEALKHAVTVAARRRDERDAEKDQRRGLRSGEELGDNFHMIGCVYFFFGLALMTTVTSVNVNGPRARGKMKGLIYVYRSDILCIQETNWDEVNEEGLSAAFQTSLSKNRDSPMIIKTHVIKRT